WRSWELWKPIDAAQITDAGLATVLGLMGLLVWIAAIGHLLVILTRDAALMVIVATAPIAAAGLANETTRAWFWKAFRWFHAAAFTPLLVVLVTGVGMKLAEGVATSQTTSVEASVGTAVPAIVLICIAVVCPLALFKMLAFVDPGTSSGAAMRAGLAATGGLQGLLRGGASSPASSSDAAAQASSTGRSAGEDSAEAATTTRASSAIQGAMAVLGPAGRIAATGLGALTTIGAYATTVMSDMANQEGVGNNSYYPDYTDRSRRDAARANREQQGSTDDQPATSEPDSSTPAPQPPTTTGPTPPPAASPSGVGGSGGAAAAGSTDAAAAAAAL
ncbi:MAG: type IV secretion system protein, partial [Propionicimonas sp.]|nr:type IV secretion system protein [Propionicimonas sp.]